jgi:hypothetical protein
MSDALRIEKLRRDHAVESFDCGKAPLNRFLIQFAFQNQQANASQTYLAVRDDEVIGYYTLVFGEVAFEDAPDRLKRGDARHPVPLMILARLAVASNAQGERLGAGLLKDAMIRTLQAADIAGLRALAVQPSVSTSTSISSPRPAIPCIFSFYSKIFGLWPQADTENTQCKP